MIALKNVLSSLANREWWVLGAALIVAGFLLDGATEVGHHAGLIAGGILIGSRLRR